MTAITYNAAKGSFIDHAISAWMNDTNGTTDYTANSYNMTMGGTVSSAAALPGAELLRFYNWSGSNYFQRAYNAVFDFGTGDFFVAIAFKRSANSVLEYMIHRRDTGGAGAYWAITMSADGTVNFNVNGTSASSPDAYDDDLWHIAVGVRRSGVAYLYIDGALVNYATASANVSNGTAVIRVGCTTSGGSAFGGSLTQAQVGDTFPADIGSLIYEAEKVMFSSNTIYTVVGVSYAIEFGPQDLTRSANTVKSVQRSMGGQGNTLKFRDEYFWQVTTDVVDKDAFDEYRRFLDSVSDGQTFTFDPYGTVSAVDAPKSVELESTGYTEGRFGPRLLNASFTVREI